MKLFKYIWRNATRNKLRSSLTILSVGFSLALMTVLYGYLAMQDDWAKAAKVYNRVVVLNKQGFSGKLPIAYVERVRQADGVKAAVPYAWFGGNYEDKVATFARFATDPRELSMFGQNSRSIRSNLPRGRRIVAVVSLTVDLPTKGLEGWRADTAQGDVLPV